MRMTDGSLDEAASVHHPWARLGVQPLAVLRQCKLGVHHRRYDFRSMRLVQHAAELPC